jgi:hypothetical protein
MRITLKLLNLLITIVGVALFSASILLASAQSTTNATASAASTVRDGMFNPTAHLDTAQITDSRPVPVDDATAEGQDVLPLSWHAAPADLWSALTEQHMEWYDDDVTSIGTMWVPVGTVVDVPGGLYLATLDGWAGCQDFETFDGECSATGPVEMLDVEPVPATVIYGAGAGALCGGDDQCAALDADRKLAGLPALNGPAYGTEDDTAQVSTTAVQTVAYATATPSAPAAFSRQCVKAARDILRASQRGVRIEEDLSYRGMTNRAATCNDDLATAFYADGHDFTGKHGAELRTFLRHVVKTGQAPQVQTPGKIRAEDGSWVPADYYAHVSGPSQALCDAYGKRRVTDPVYGHRCV